LTDKRADAQEGTSLETMCAGIGRGNKAKGRQKVKILSRGRGK
jgi:hypothetical protein